MKKILVSFILILVGINQGEIKAQIDTSFWFASPWITPDHWWKDDIKLHLSTFSASTTVRLRQPAAVAPNRYDTVFTIAANTTFDYTFWRDKLAGSANLAFDSLETRPSNTVVPYGIYISSTEKMTVVYDVISRAPGFLNPEAFSLKGRNGMGTEFYCPFQTKWRTANRTSDLNGDGIITQPKQQINIVATQSNTTVWVTPKCNVVGHLANVSYSVLLNNAGDAYTVENLSQLTYSVGQSLAGSYITSDKAISVTVSDDSVLAVTGCADLMGDQIVPTDAIGTDYVLNKGFLNAPEFEGAYIVATANNTSLTINDGVITNTVINQGDTYYYKTLQPLTYVNASNDVYCLHATGFGCELGEALLPPLNCAGSGTVSFSRNNTQAFILNILCKNGSQSTFTLNNSQGSVIVPITASAFTMVPGTSLLPGGPFWGAQVNLTSTVVLPIGSYTIANPTDVFALGVIEGGMTTGGSYYYASSFSQRVGVVTQTVAPLCVSATNTIALTGTVTGGAVSGVWTTAIGTGTFAPYTSSLITVSTTYSLSGMDTLLSSLKFYLTSLGSCAPVQDSVIVQINQRPQLIVGSGAVLCKNVIVPVALSGTVSNCIGGSWSGGSGNFTNLGLNTSYFPAQNDITAGSITLSLTTQGPLPGCSNITKTVSVSFLNIPTPVITPSVTSICFGLPVTLTVSGASTYTWNAGSTTSTIILSPSVSTTYSVTGTGQNGCIGNSTASVNVLALPVVSISSASAICLGATATLIANGAATYSWSTNSANPQIIVSPTATTIYSVTGTNVNGCQNFATTSITVNPLPTVSVATSNSIVCAGQSATLSATGGTLYNWTPGPATQNISVSPLGTTTYTVRVTGINGCEAKATITQSVSECTEISVLENEEFFSVYPNPSNGEFVIQSTVKISSLQIINQLGQIVRILSLEAGTNYKATINDLADGVYFIKAQQGEKILTEKIIVRR